MKLALSLFDGGGASLSKVPYYKDP